MNAKLTGQADRLTALVWPSPPDARIADLAELFRDHQLELVRLALLMGVDRGTAEDVVQDAFERLYRRRWSLRNPDAGLAYARSAVLNGCRTVHRRAAVARRHAPELVLPATEDLPDLGDRSELAAALRRLPRRQREALVLRYYADLDVAEIAATMGVGAGAVRSHAARGLAALARILEMETPR
jgi:RNA polymerase sigma-70 factor (sigma-E family)